MFLMPVTCNEPGLLSYTFAEYGDVSYIDIYFEAWLAGKGF